MPCTPGAGLAAVHEAARRRDPHGTSGGANDPRRSFDYVDYGDLGRRGVLARWPRPATTQAPGRRPVPAPVLRLRLASPELIVDVGRVAELRGIREDGDALVIGAMTTHHDVMNDPLVRPTRR